MKPIILFIFIITSRIAFTQQNQISGQTIRSGSLPFHYLTVSLKHGDSVIQEAVPDADGKFTLNHVKKGFYNLMVKRPFHKDYLADSLLVVTGKPIYLTIYPCFYSKEQIPKCIGGHTDQIIPIQYGKPTAETMRNAEKGLVRIGGCMVSGCDPNYY